jgi:hypothetical protein
VIVAHGHAVHGRAPAARNLERGDIGEFDLTAQVRAGGFEQLNAARKGVAVLPKLEDGRVRRGEAGLAARLHADAVQRNDDAVLRERRLRRAAQLETELGELTAVSEMIENLKGEILNFFFTAVCFCSLSSGNS